MVWAAPAVGLCVQQHAGVRAAGSVDAEDVTGLIHGVKVIRQARYKIAGRERLYIPHFSVGAKNCHVSPAINDRGRDLALGFGCQVPAIRKGGRGICRIQGAGFVLNQNLEFRRAKRERRQSRDVQLLVERHVHQLLAVPIARLELQQPHIRHIQQLLRVRPKFREHLDWQWVRDRPSGRGGCIAPPLRRRVRRQK